MSATHFLRTVLILLISTMLIACSGAEQDVDDDQTDDVVDEQNNDNPPDESDDDEEEEDEEDDTTQPDTPQDVERDLVRSLIYREDTGNACPLSRCGRDISVSVVLGQIGRSTDGSGYSLTMSAEDVTYIQENIFTEALHEKMLDGWDCPEPEEVEGDREVEYEFRGYVWDGTSYIEAIQSVTGCFEAEREDVVEIAEHFKSLSEKYFD